MKNFVYRMVLFTMLGLYSVSALCADISAPKEVSDEEKQQALVHFQKGQARFSAGEFLLAVEHFKISYEVTGSLELLYNIAKCYEEAHENEQAIVHYKMYLQNSDGQDSDEIEKKIIDLGGEPEKKSSHGADGGSSGTSEGDFVDVEEKKGENPRIHKFAFELAMGPGFVILTPDTGVTMAGGTESTKRNYFSIDILAHFFLNDWFAVSAIVLIGPYMEGSTPFGAREPKSHVGLGIGVGIKKTLGGRASLMTNILAIPCAISRESISKRATWIAFDLRVGLNIQVSQKLGVNLTAVVEGGPAFVIKPTGTGDWQTGMLVSVGPRAGITYTF